MPRSFSLSLALALAACSGASHELDDAGVAPDAWREACAPISCAAVDAECGTIDDGCGGTLACGECAAPQRCGVEAANRCGGECTSDAHCPDGLHCDVESARCREGCRTSTDVTVDLPRVEVALEVRLDGGPLPPLPGGSGPQLFFYPTTVPDLGATTHLYEDGLPREGVVLSLSPGPHEVYYYIGSSPRSSGWPENRGSSLGVVEIAPDATSLVIDVPRVRVDLSARIGDEPLPALAAEGLLSSLPQLVLHDEANGEVPIPLHEEASDGVRPPRAELGAWVIPGTYDLLYDALHDLEPWPTNTSTPLRRALDLREDRTGEDAIAVDLRAVEIEVVATIGGAPLPGDGYASIAFVVEGADADDASRNGYVVLGADTTAAPRRARLLPGRYDLWYVAEREPRDGWPRFSAPLGAIELTEDTVLPLDIPVTEVELAIELEGATSSDDACVPRLRVGSERFWQSGDLELGAPASPFPAETVRAIPATYPVRYAFEDHCAPGEWPAVPFQTSLTIPPEDGAITMRIPRRRLRVRVTLDGAPPPALSAGVSPALFLMRGDDRSSSFPLFRAEGDGLAPADVIAFVEPGTYDLYYAGAGDHAASWPWAPAVLRRDLDVVEDVDIEVDIRRTAISFGVTMDGRPVAYPEDPSWAFEPAKVYLAPNDWLGPSVSFGIFSDGPALERFEGYLVPGTYQIFSAHPFRHAARAESDFPSTGARLGCWTVPAP